MTTAIDPLNTSSNEQKTSTIRIPIQSKLILDQILSEANDKELGVKIKPETVVALALTLIGKEQIEKLKGDSLTNADKLELRYREYAKKHGAITKDDFLGRVLRGDLT